MTDLRLKRHETFSIRDGWLQKGINIISESPECFKKDSGPKYFGLGANMCKSLKYWLVATDIAKFLSIAELTTFGNLLKRYDPYLQDQFSWFMIHAKLAMNFVDAPVINQLFNVSYSKFDKESFTYYLCDYFKANDMNISSNSSLESDINIALRSYCIMDESNPENNMSCPLGRLGLLRMDGKRNYTKQQPTYSSLSYLAVYYVMSTCMKLKEDFNLEDLLKKENNPLKVFNISKSTLFLYLDEMKNYGIINLVKTAGLNTIHINKPLDLNGIFEQYYEGK